MSCRYNVQTCIVKDFSKFSFVFLAICNLIFLELIRFFYYTVCIFFPFFVYFRFYVCHCDSVIKFYEKPPISLSGPIGPPYQFQWSIGHRQDV